MGLYHFSSSSFDGASPNPDPSKYEWLSWRQIGDYTVLLVRYEGCTNYEGKKTLVYKATIEQLRAQKLLDPHFSDNKDFLSPIARFEPTEQGCRNALEFVEMKARQ